MKGADSCRKEELTGLQFLSCIRVLAIKEIVEGELSVMILDNLAFIDIV